MRRNKINIKNIIQKKNILYSNKKNQNMNDRLEKRIGIKPIMVDLVNSKSIGQVKILNNEDSFRYLVKKIDDENKLAFVRYGDADYLMMLKNNLNKTLGSNNKMIVTESFQKELIESHNIYSDNYLIGSILSTTIKNKLYSYNVFLNQNIGILRPIIDNNQINLNNLLSAVNLTETFISNPELFYTFTESLNKRRVMFVGSYFHKNIEYLYGNVSYFIKTNKYNSYSIIDVTLNEILKNIENVDIIIFSNGQTSRILIKRLWLMGFKKIMLDVGSLTDYSILNTNLYNEVQIRGHIKEHKNKLIENFNKIICLNEK